jgi:GT2 family glycosyltransferase
VTEALLSIVIVSFNAREHLRRCLDGLLTHIEGAFEVVVVDNASADGCADMVERDFPRVRVFRNATNTGFAAAANVGAANARGDVILYLNPDSELHDDPFGGPAAYLREHPDVGALGVKLLDPDGALQLSVRRFPGLEASLFNRYSLLTRLWPSNPWSRRYLMSGWQHDALSDVDWVSGACLMTTRATLDRVGYFDDAFFWGFEDVDFCQRVHRAGLRVVYWPDSSVVHAIGASARTVPSRAIIARHRGMWRYYRRYLSPNPAVDALVLAGIAGRCSMQVAVGWLRRRLA